MDDVVTGTRAEPEVVRTDTVGTPPTVRYVVTLTATAETPVAGTAPTPAA